MTSSRKKPRKPPPTGIRVAFLALQERVKTLEEAFNTNTKVFSDGVQMLELQHEAMRRAMNDLLHGRVRVYPPLGGTEVIIDFNSYLKECIEDLVAKEEKSGPGKILASVDEDAPIIFGGDQ